MPFLIVFDLDGTLVDSRRDLAESANELLSHYGASSLDVEDVGRMVGDGARVLVERVLAARQVQAPLPAALDQFLSIYERRLVQHTRPYPGIEAMLERVRAGARLAVLTNKPSRHTMLLLQALRLSHYFFEALGGDTPFPRKPDPSALEHLMTVAGVSPGQTMMVGDSMIDVETAHRAGAASCFIHHGYGRPDPARLSEWAVRQVVDAQSLTDEILAFITPERRSGANPT